MICEMYNMNNDENKIFSINMSKISHSNNSECFSKETFNGTYIRENEVGTRNVVICTM